MPRHRSALALLPLLVWIVVHLGACSASFYEQPRKPQSVQRTVDAPGEILSENDDEDEFGAGSDESVADKAGGTLVALTFVAVILGAALLPLLLFL